MGREKRRFSSLQTSSTSLLSILYLFSFRLPLFSPHLSPFFPFLLFFTLLLHHSSISYLISVLPGLDEEGLLLFTLPIIGDGVIFIAFLCPPPPPADVGDGGAARGTLGDTEAEEEEEVEKVPAVGRFEGNRFPHPPPPVYDPTVGINEVLLFVPSEDARAMMGEETEEEDTEAEGESSILSCCADVSNCRLTFRIYLHLSDLIEI